MIFIGGENTSNIKEKYVIIACNPDGTYDVLDWLDDYEKAKNLVEMYREAERKSWLDEGGEYLLLERQL